ncbi:hypothetical protein [Roseibium marinum]|uniref:Uncharacterized protein n=1 Tax=Roseibium marinum TaxID=281252 RepID=A0A2S3UMM3_9HYPH|nr:hypothetical protein [Roseibium marinum]POF28931.1 hypothetical protein CLV41_111183 [Roseibium marinum]
MVPIPEETGKKPIKGSTPEQTRKHLDDLLDEALDETFPASDPPAMLEPGPESSTDPKPDGAA